MPKGHINYKWNIDSPKSGSIALTATGMNKKSFGLIELAGFIF